MRIVDGGESFRRLWRNTITGQGTDRDKGAAWSIDIAATLVTDPEKTALFHRDYMARRVVEMLPSQALKKGFSLTSKEDNDLAVSVQEDLKELGYTPKAKEAWIWARNYGGAVIIMGLSGPANEPSKPDEKPQWLEVLDRRWVTVHSFDHDSASPHYGKPLTWNVSNPLAVTGASRIVHRDRMLFFPGLMTADDVSASLGYWQMSLHDLAIQAIADYHAAWGNAGALLANAHQGVFKIKGFANLVASNNREVALARLQVVDVYRSILRSIVVDKDGEDFEYKTASLTGVSDLMQQFQQMIASVARTPVTVLMGQSPAGMNATGESDFRLFADMTEDERQNYHDPIVMQLAERLARARGAERAPADLEIVYPSVWTPSPKESADIRTAQANADKAAIDSQMFYPEEVAIFRTENGPDAPLTLTPEGKKARETALTDLYSPKPSEAGTVPGETTITKILSANAALRLLGQDEAKLPDGSPDPDGNLPIEAYAEKKKADGAPPAPGVQSFMDRLADWNEEQERADNGQFGSGSGSSGGGGSESKDPKVSGDLNARLQQERQAIKEQRDKEEQELTTKRDEALSTTKDKISTLREHSTKETERARNELPKLESNYKQAEAEYEREAETVSKALDEAKELHNFEGELKERERILTKIANGERVHSPRAIEMAQNPEQARADFDRDNERLTNMRESYAANSEEDRATVDRLLKQEDALQDLEAEISERKAFIKGEKAREKNLAKAEKALEKGDYTAVAGHLEDVDSLDEDDPVSLSVSEAAENLRSVHEELLYTRSTNADTDLTLAQDAYETAKEGGDQEEIGQAREKLLLAKRAAKAAEKEYNAL